MEKEKRLIDANELPEKIGSMKGEITHNRGGYRYCNEEEKNEWDKLDFFDILVYNAPTVDAVEVVRCEDCEHCVKNPAGYVCYDPRDIYAEGVKVYANDFCSYGERRSDNATD